jgi:hypothetical protein
MKKIIIFIKNKNKEMEEIINQMENTELHCGETEFYNLNKLHQPLLDGDVTIENLDDLQKLYQTYLTSINFQDDERDDVKKIYNLLNDYISSYNLKGFKNCVEISTQIYDYILIFLNTYEE